MKKIIILICCLLLTEKNTRAQDIKFTVEEAPEWTGLFRRNNGWFGGDGIYAIPLNGKEANGPDTSKTLFVFSDTMIGKHKDNQLEPGSKMIHNSLAILSGDQPEPAQIEFYWTGKGRQEAGKDKQEAETVFVPRTPMTGPKDYYWLGDGFVNPAKNNAIYLFGYRIRNTGAGTFGFEEAGNTLIKIEQDQLSKAIENGFTAFRCEQKDTPFYFDKESKGTDRSDSGNSGPGSFGAGIYVNTRAAGAAAADGYVYIYGVRGTEKKLLVSRVSPENIEDFSKWTFWDGSAWNTDMQQAKAIAEGVSNELSLSTLPNGSYALVFQEKGMGRYVCMRIGTTPAGPFGPVIRLWDCSGALSKKTYFPYNAKAYPHLSKKGELLISYNINSFDFFKDLATDPQLYRPRFIRVRFE